MDAGLIVQHLVDISKGECSITEESILALDSEEEQRIHLGLLTLHEEIEYNKSKLEKSLKEKEVLLQEIHHRVKNNLQIIISLLKLQGMGVKDAKTHEVLADCQARVGTMALIHSRLLHSGSLSHVDFKSYLEELVHELKAVHGSLDSAPQIRLEVPTFQVKLDTAIPLGLIINEILTNSLKYGKNEGGEVLIYLSVKETSPKHYRLRIGDEGGGYPRSIFESCPESLGVQLIRDLTEQIGGTVEKVEEPRMKGTHYELNFILTD